MLCFSAISHQALVGDERRERKRETRVKEGKHCEKERKRIFPLQSNFKERTREREDKRRLIVAFVILLNRVTAGGDPIEGGNGRRRSIP